MPEYGSSRGFVFTVDVKWNVADYGELTRLGVAGVAKAIRDQGRADVARAGHFGRWPEAVTTRVAKAEGGFKIGVYQKPGFLKVFEYGATSRGRPLLWMPAFGSGGLRIRKYRGRLIQPRGRKVLLRATDSEVAYVGITSVTNRPRFHIRQIAIQEANKFVSYMRQGAQQVASRGGGGARAA